MQPTTSSNLQDNKPCRKDFPVNLLVHLIKAEPVLTVEAIGPEGDIKFRVSLRDLGVSRSALARARLCRTAFFVNLVGDLLVRKNLARFAEMLEQIEPEKYDRMVNGFQHRHFGMMVDENDVICFTFHVSLVQQVLAEDLDGVFTV